jgi:hypothetical protein
MKKYFTALVLGLLLQQVSAASLYEQLCTFNPNWKKYAARVPDGKAQDFRSDREYIQAHLGNVLTILRTNPVAQLKQSQYQSRIYLIGLLESYRAAGNFPLNYYRHERIPVFIDEHNTHCAVGFLMQQTGQEALARRIAATDNYVWVKDIHDAAVPDWQLASGFSMEELKLIQGAYDYYMPDALILPNKYEVPQKPACMIAYFEGQPKTAKNIWLKGEGRNGFLHGRWEQKAAGGLPWIIGFYQSGKRSGKWSEYYQGTSHICRTENWRNDKLNGIRKRFDHEGRVIEEILFKDGKAVTKTNYDLGMGRTYVRKPLDSTLVWTEIFDAGGAMIAAGHEKIHNPGNLLWFQNIELTALNSVSISARSASLSNGAGNENGVNSNDPFVQRMNLYNAPPLVTYKKEGRWMYYREYKEQDLQAKLPMSGRDYLYRNYHQFSLGWTNVDVLQEFTANFAYDSILAEYTGDQLENLYGYGSIEYLHLHVNYYEKDTLPDWSQLIHMYVGPQIEIPRVREFGQYNEAHQQIGVWKHFDRQGRLYKTESFLIPRDEYEVTSNTKRRK